MPHGGAGRSYKNPTVGLKNRVQMPHSGTTPKLYFPVNNLQNPHLWFLFTNCKRNKVQHIHEQIVCVSYFYYPAYWITVS